MSDVSKSTLVGIVIDPESGEFTGELYEGDKIVRKKPEELKGVVAAKGFGPFVSVYSDTLSRLDLDKNDYKIIFCMMNGIKYNSYMVVKGNGAPMTRDYISEKTGIYINSVDRSLKKLVELRLFAKTKSGFDIKYFANPYVFKKGGTIQSTLFDLFKKFKD